MNVRYFREIDRIWGPHEVDLFATKENTQREKEFSWGRDPEPLGVNAFHQEWKTFHRWADPPFNLIGRILVKVKQEHSNITLLAPFWPTAAWYPSLFQMSVTTPILLPQDKHMFVPGPSGHVIPLYNKSWRIAVFNISGKTGSIRGSPIGHYKYYQEKR